MYIKSSRVKARHSSSQHVPNTSRSRTIKTMHIKRIKISRHLFQARVEDSHHALKVIKANFYAKYSFRPSLCQTSFLSPFASHFVVVDQSSVSSVELLFFHTIRVCHIGFMVSVIVAVCICTFWCPTDSCRNASIPPDSTGFHRNLVDSSGIEPESSGMSWIPLDCDRRDLYKCL